jgi:hypothetical protein
VPDNELGVLTKISPLVNVADACKRQPQKLVSYLPVSIPGAVKPELAKQRRDRLAEVDVPAALSNLFWAHISTV